MKTSTILASVLVVIGLFYSLKKEETNTPDTKIDPPSEDLQLIVSPVANLFSRDTFEQAAELSAFYLEASKVIRRDGENDKVVKTSSHLKTFCERSVVLRFKGVFDKVPGLSNAIHGENGALMEILGDDPGVMDHEKVADALHAIAWACQEAGEN